MQIGSSLKTYRFLALLLLSGFIFPDAGAQMLQNVRFSTSGKQIIITYDIIGAQPGQSFDVSVFYSTDGGKSLSSALRQVTGDAGPGVTAGSGKRVTWDVLAERDNLVGNVLFEVQAKSMGTTSTATSQTRTTPVAPPPSGSNDPYWVDIPGGTFMMGSPSNEPSRVVINETQHQVTVKSFKMGKNEVTFEEYDAFCTATRRRKPDDDGWGRGTRPVMNVTWEDAKAFADWKGCRLPTEAEWEYACRAGSTTAFYTGDNITTEQANFNGIKEPYNGAAAGKNLAKTQPVGSYSPNSFGLYDMHGNVSEWVSDWYADSYQSGNQTNPTGPDRGSEKIRKGGSWYDPAWRCRSAYRLRVAPDRIDRIIGIRLVKDN
jgi:formylglycine-generating enzyme